MLHKYAKRVLHHFVVREDRIEIHAVALAKYDYQVIPFLAFLTMVKTIKMDQQ